MKHERTCYVVGGADNYANWMETKITKDIRKADFIVLSGGEDVTPALYGRNPHSTTHCSPLRDGREMDEFKIARDLGLPVVGICRGSQMCCVLAGGQLVQHQSHPGRHDIKVIEMEDITKPSVKTISVTSTHHQRQYPWYLKPSERKLYGWCNLSPFSYGQDGEDLTLYGDDPDPLPEVEICYYPKIKALAIQSHPEYAYGSTAKRDVEYIAYHRHLLNMLLANKL